VKFPDIFPVTCHTAFVGPGSTFVAIKGYQSNGIQFIPKAIEKGASTIVIQKDQNIELYQDLLQDVSVVRVENARKALAELSAHAAGNPAKKLTIIGITGTKGKTTTAYLLDQMLKKAGYNRALLTTVKNSINSASFSAPLTTPQPDYLHQFLKLCVCEGVTHVVMEVAAQAIPLYRVHGIEFSGVIFSNFGQEHLEFFDSMDSYFVAKKQVLNYRKKNAPLWINNDDEIISPLKKLYLNVHTFGINASADIIMLDDNHINVDEQEYELNNPSLPGLYNRYNIMAAVGMAVSLGIKIPVIQRAIASFQGVPGRLERYLLPNGAIAIIDYAHNPLSYKALLPALREKTDHLIVLFGAGGERDPSRRPQMGQIAAQYADEIIVTSDNPRSENPQLIIDDILSGIKDRSSVVCELDREKAIQIAYTHAHKGTIIALLGKGPDEYQIVGNNKTYFSEQAILQSFL